MAFLLLAHNLTVSWAGHGYLTTKGGAQDCNTLCLLALTIIRCGDERGVGSFCWSTRGGAHIMTMGKVLLVTLVGEVDDTASKGNTCCMIYGFTTCNF